MLSPEPYHQRAVIKGKTADEVYRAVRLWLAENNCGVNKASPPSYVDASYGANAPSFWLGLRDDYPKKIEVRVTAFGSDVILYVSVAQETPRFKELGYLHWGRKIEELYRSLGVEPRIEEYMSLYPRTMVRGEFTRKLRFYGLLVAAMTVFFYFVGRLAPDSVLLFTVMFLLPAIIVGFIDTIDYWRLLTNSRVRV
ncbi:hypothetical protein JXL21_01715 [Candidatus Bathyarchaeota archaeon]|nr:hypothetical protein [Candidatus Bathyarchaeota archaeon]